MFRSADGRSIARALACLLAFNLFITGLHSGAMAAAAASDAVICSVMPVDDNTGPSPTHDHLTSCCLSANSGAALLPDAPPMAEPIRPSDSFATVPHAQTAGSTPVHYRPRGPPSSI
jgi:hypothetical protein